VWSGWYVLFKKGLYFFRDIFHPRKLTPFLIRQILVVSSFSSTPFFELTYFPISFTFISIFTRLRVIIMCSAYLKTDILGLSPATSLLVDNAGLQCARYHLLLCYIGLRILFLLEEFLHLCKSIYLKKQIQILTISSVHVYDILELLALDIRGLFWKSNLLCKFQEFT